LTGPVRVLADEALRLDASGSTGAIARYQWSFGDGVYRSADATLTYTSVDPGTYTVTVTVLAATGQASSASITTAVTEPPELPPSTSEGAAEREVERPNT
jgi:large repetitive protein